MMNWTKSEVDEEEIGVKAQSVDYASSILNDVAESIYEVRYSAPIFSLIILVVATASVADFNHVLSNFGIVSITRPNNISSLVRF